MLKVENKVIAITGASSGIGEASAKLLAQNGAKVVLGARRTEKLEKIVEDIRSSSGIAELKALDVTDRQEMNSFIHFLQARYHYD
jgi:NADP-dependent 3-hydroxy acid dehydrogenase YdfG